MSNFLCNDYVITNSSTFNESLLRVISVISKKRLLSVGKSFVDDFVDHIE